MTDMENFRKKIDEIDEKMVQLLAERFEVTHQVGLYKKENNLPVQDPEREKRQMDKFETLAKKFNTDPVVIQKTFRTIIDLVLERHEQLRK